MKENKPNKLYRKYTVIRAFAITAITFLVLVSTAGAVSVSIKNLQNLTSGSYAGSYAEGINDKGQIVGYSFKAAGVEHAVIWQNGVITDLGTLHGEDYCYADSINNNGQIVGVCGSHGFLWKNGVMTDLGTLSGGSFSYPSGINDNGQIVGCGDKAPGKVRAVLWQNGVKTDLGTLSGGSLSHANSINNKGQIVGDSDNANGKEHAVIWQNGVITDLGTLPGGYGSSALSINDKGQIVGWSDNAAGVEHAVIWQNGVITDLGILPGGDYSFANSINNNGQIVGACNFGLDTAHATLWQNGVMTDLGSLPAKTFSIANTINNNGQIVGSSSTGYPSATIWTVTNVLQKPVAAFIASPTSGYIPLKVQFKDHSTNNPTSWKWDFGDGTTSTTHNPLHTYIKAGSLTVTLTATNAAGSSTLTKTAYIKVVPPKPPVAAFSATPLSGKKPLTVSFTDKSTNNPTSWSWVFGDGTSSTAKNPAHKYTKAGTFSVKLTVKNTAGNNSLTKSKYIIVK